MKQIVTFLFLSTFLTLKLFALENVFMTFKYGLSGIDDSFTLNKNSFGLDITADTGDNLKPKFDIAYVDVSEGSGGVDFLLQFSANALYEGSHIYGNSMIPYAYAGIGYEYVNKERTGFESAPYIQAAVGMELPFFTYTNDDFKVITEARWLQIVSSNDGEEGEASIFLGFRMSTQGLGSYSGISPYREYEVDNSSYYPDLEADESSSQREESIPKHHLFTDSDGDGVPDKDDKCPNTPKDIYVGKDGCAYGQKIGSKNIGKKRIVFPKLPKQRRTLEISFAMNSATMDSASKKEIRHLVQRLQSDGYHKITIEGYTDNSGSRNENIMLSKKRADAVKQLMVNYGLDSQKIHTVGKGDLNPIADNDSEFGREQNRRIEIVIE